MLRSFETSLPQGYMRMPMLSVETLVRRCLKFSGERTSLTAQMANVGGVLRPSFLGNKDGTEEVQANMSIDVFPGESVVIGLDFDEALAGKVGRPVAGLDRGDFKGNFGDADTVEKGFQRMEARVRIADGVAVLSAKKVGESACLLTGITYDEAAIFTSACIGAFEYHQFKQGIDMTPAPLIGSQE